MAKFVPALLVGTGIVFAASGPAQVISVTKAPVVTGLDGADLYRARHVLRRFFASEQRPQCYRVLFSEFEGNLRVDFVPKHSDPVIVEGEPEPAIAPPCGRNIGYVIDNRGNVLRSIFSR